ncbi:hypothetical protein CANINC_002970 [Pichia inconspicua]|uniref:Uncharacterized protein n=1 Tax=Pichia inconspicua TaxID=52247 RepID=A0A4T0X1G2_9ASCO|nr:hypothetical protein CANINC_002970 [[Candida] inconspicua]
MSYFADNGSIRALTKLFENVHVPVLFTHVEAPSETSTDLKTVEPVNDVENAEDLNHNVDLDVEKAATDVIDSVSQDKTLDVTIPNETNVYKHLKEYPIVNSWLKIFHWVPLPRVVRPALMRIAYSDSLSPYTITVDNFLVSGLNSLDSSVPGIRTLRLRDIRNVILDTPIKNIAATTNYTIYQFSDLSQRVLITPSRNGIHQIRSLRGEYLPMAGSEPLIRSQLNPLIKQVNERLASNINKLLTSNENEANEEISINYVHLDTDSNEITQTIQLISTAATRLRPILLERLKQLSSLPENSAKYVSAVYQDSKTNRGDGQMVVILASLETIRKLSTEGWNFVSSSGFMDFVSSNPTLDEKLSIVEETNEAVVLDPIPTSN